jgi:hypothetical protein
LTKAREVSGTPEAVLASGSFSSVASVSISNALSDTYKFYTLHLYVTTAGDVTVNLRFRENTTDVTTSYNTAGAISYYANSIAAYYPSTSRANLVLTAAASTMTVASALIFRPDATQGYFTGSGVDRSNLAVVQPGGFRTGMTAFNGITIFPNSTTFTGYYILTGRRV